MLIYKYSYTTKIKQPQKIGTITIYPAGGQLTEREYKDIKKDIYGASLLDSKMLIVKDKEVTDSTPDNQEDIPDFEQAEGHTYSGKADSPDQEHSGFEPK